MRERTTWNREDIVKKAAMSRKADPYTMNQDHPQPAADKYVTGDPSTFAEDVHTPNTWESEYSGDAVKRDEIGLPAFRSDTFNHAEKTAAVSPVLVKKADLCVATAKLMLAGKKSASPQALENQAFALMFMPDQALVETHKRLAGEQQQDEGDAADEGQDKQAQDQEQVEQEQVQDKQAQEEQVQVQQEQDKQAQDQQDQGENEQVEQGKQASALQGLASEAVKLLQAGDAAGAQAKIAKLVEAQRQTQANQQQLQAQIQQLIQQAMGQQPAPQQQVSDEQVLDQMLATDSCGPMAEVDIQMDPAPMDGLDLSGEDEMLRQMFAQEDEQEPEQDQGEQKQASVRTASTRTVGTRPTAGVAKLGGSVGSPGGVSDLSSLWKSAPDVREAFGLK